MAMGHQKQSATASGHGGQVELIPGLPDHIGLICLSLLPLPMYHVLKRVSRSWRRLVESKDLFQARLLTGQMHQLLAVLAEKPQEQQWEVYDPQDNIWYPFACMHPRLRFTHISAVALHTKLYVLVGCFTDGQTRQPELHVYDLVTATWTRERHPVQNYNGMPSITCMAGKLFVMGHVGDHELCGEVLDPAAPQPVWQPTQGFPLLFSREQYACLVLDDRLYYPSQGLVYDPAVNEWSQLNNLEPYTLPEQVVNCGDDVMGVRDVGHHGKQEWAVYSCDVVTGRTQCKLKSDCLLQKQTSQRRPRKGVQRRTRFGVAGMRGKLYVLGGRKGGGYGKSSSNARRRQDLSWVQEFSEGRQKATWRRLKDMELSSGPILATATIQG